MINDKEYALDFKLIQVAKIVRCISIRENAGFSWESVIKIAERLLFKIVHDSETEKMLYWKIYQVHRDIIPHIQYTKELELSTGKINTKVANYFLLSDRQANISIFRIVKYLYRASELKWITVVVQPWGHQKRMEDQSLISLLTAEKAAELFTEQCNDSELLNIQLKSTFELVDRCTQFVKMNDFEWTLMSMRCLLAPMIQEYEESIFTILRQRLLVPTKRAKSKCQIS